MHIDRDGVLQFDPPMRQWKDITSIFRKEEFSGCFGCMNVEKSVGNIIKFIKTRRFVIL